MSQSASELLLSSLQPRLVFNGHTHHSCHRIHKNGIQEFTLPSFSWRNRNDPSFMMVSSLISIVFIIKLELVQRKLNTTRIKGVKWYWNFIAYIDKSRNATKNFDGRRLNGSIKAPWGVILIISSEVDLHAFGKRGQKAVTRRGHVSFTTKRGGVATPPTPPFSHTLEMFYFSLKIAALQTGAVEIAVTDNIVNYIFLMG